MKIYNTMTRSKETLESIEEGKLNVYACGPTVYNLMHIGNARQICVFDVFRRYMKYKGINVTYAQNFTDIDDKIIAKANEQGTDYYSISNEFINEYFTDAHGLNVMDADIHPRATENIEQIIDIITSLIEKGYAYSTENGDVYYSTTKFADYGKLSHQPLEDLKAGARISAGEEKRDVVDFAVWKSAKEGEPYWESPWGKGRPGWHIECSAMVRSLFGETIDIHGGGVDLIFPHHENEIAQSEGSTGKPLAKYWMHNGHVNVDNKKMSKSLGNFFTVRDVAAEYGYEPIRYLLISSHYRSPMNYSTQSIEQSIASLERLYNCKNNLEHLLENTEIEENKDDDKTIESFAKYEDMFITAMEDDLNTANAIAAIFDLLREINTETAMDKKPSKKLVSSSLEIFMRLNGVLGLLYEKKEENADDEIKINELIAKRAEARANKDWASSDAIRDELAAMGIVIEDTPNGVKWTRK